MLTKVLAGGAMLLVTIVLFTWDSPGFMRDQPASGPPLDEIQASQLAAHVKFLSSDLLEGRAPSTRGGQLAAEYLATQLADNGFEPAGDNGTFFQNLSVVESIVDPTFVLNAGSGAPFRYGTEVISFSGVQDPRVSVNGEVVFVGHGIVAPEYTWNDYAGVDMKGKIALMMVNDPPASQAEPQLFAGDALTYYGRWTYKFEEAARQGALGAILIHTDESATYPWSVVQSGWTGTQYSLPAIPGRPVLSLKAWVTNAAATQIVSRGGKNLDELRKAARSRGGKPVPLGIQASAVLNQKVEQKSSPNVIGVLRGANPAQGVIYTAHYDHLGMRAPAPGDAPDADRIYNGATDNASGLAGVLEIAQALARAPAKPQRSIYVLFTTAEESGLLGAEYFASRPVLPADAWAANLNIDSLNMFGRTKDIVLLGAERSSLGADAAEVATRRGRVVAGDPEPGRGYFFRSDHFPLAKIGIPALSMAEPTQYIGRDPEFAKKLRDEYNNKNYHQPSDEVRGDWDYTGAVEDMRLMAELGWRLANAPTMPAYRANEQFARPRSAQSQ